MKNLKLKLAAFAGAALMTLGVNAQIDRSQMPEAGPEPEINLSKPDEFQLKNGITVMVVENNKLPRVSYQLSIDNKPYVEGDKAGVASILSAMLGNGTTSISKDEFNDEVDFLGANINFGSSGGFASGLVKYADRIVELMADAAINPLLTEEEFKKEKDKLIENLKTDEKSVDAAAGRVVGALAYGKDHAYGEFVTEETVKNVTFQDVLDFYKVRFAPNNAYIVVVGDIDTKTVKKQLKKHFGKWKKVEDLPNLPNPELTANVSETQINFVDMPNATQSNISITNNVDLKQSDEDYFAALMANNILGGGGEGYLFKNLREDKGYTYGAYSSLGANRYGVSRFNASAKVRNAVTDSAVVEFLKEIKRIRTEPVDPTTLQNAKAKYVGNFVMALERPQTIANYALNIKRNNLPQDFYAKYLENINNVSVEDVQRVANKYFKADNARVVVVGKGADVLPNLEKVGLPIKYYDKYANATEKPVFSKPLPEGLTASDVIKNYVNAVGGEAKLRDVKSTLSMADVTIAGAPFKPKAIIKQMAPNMFSMEMSIEGMGTIMKQKFDGKSGYQEQQGRKIPMSEDDVNARKTEKGLFPEIYMEAANIALESLTDVDGTDAYKIVVTKDGKTSARYYAADTGLLIRTEETQEAGGQSITSITDFSDYKEVNGVMMPQKMTITAGPQVLELNMTEVKVNEGVSAEDFN
ncbi:putative Zn-dependent peptidase [Winogradskyella wandonensis]|uniref:Putative Zn-dependent peptidase n=1 Tax=Winogradskyella wandonensis TaxID=1442586 RepID=A0A4R1KUW6_9FLAO|nr:insulinase family protein [Winogradskyella wandonensis]TCK67999.1 putative Zn-dependent peptidase [Winogradskyella wandonensis]